MTPAIHAAEQSNISFHLHRYEHHPAAESFDREAAEKLKTVPDRNASISGGAASLDLVAPP